MKKNNVKLSQHKIKRATKNTIRIKNKLKKDMQHTNMLERAISKGLVLDFNKVNEGTVSRLIQRQVKNGQG
jgi:hypothetical protein